MIRLVCTGSRKRPHRRQVIYTYEGDLATAPPALPSGARLSLACSYCRLAPGVSDAQLAALLTIAAASGGVLDISRRGAL